MHKSWKSSGFVKNDGLHNNKNGGLSDDGVDSP